MNITPSARLLLAPRTAQRIPTTWFGTLIVEATS